MEQPLQRQQQQQQPQPQLQPQPQQQQQQSQPQPLQLDFSKLAQQLQQSSAAIARLKLPQELAGACEGCSWLRASRDASSSSVCSGQLQPACAQGYLTLLHTAAHRCRCQHTCQG